MNRYLLGIVFLIISSQLHGNPENDPASSQTVNSLSPYSREIIERNAFRSYPRILRYVRLQVKINSTICQETAKISLEHAYNKQLRTLPIKAKQILLAEKLNTQNALVNSQALKDYCKKDAAFEQIYGEILTWNNKVKFFSNKACTWKHLESDIKKEKLSKRHRYSSQQLLKLKHAMPDKIISTEKRQRLKDLKIHRPQKLSKKNNLCS